jgi:hypothetical protein
LSYLIDRAMKEDSLHEHDDEPSAESGTDAANDGDSDGEKA